MVHVPIFAYCSPVIDLRAHVNQPCLYIVQPHFTYMIHESICKYVIIRCQLRQRQPLLLRRGCIGRHFETAMILNASRNILCPGGRHMLTRSEDEDQDVLRGESKAARRRTSGLLQTKIHMRVCQKIHSLDTRAYLSSEDTLWPCNRRFRQRRKLFQLFLLLHIQVTLVQSNFT